MLDFCYSGTFGQKEKSTLVGAQRFPNITLTTCSENTQEIYEDQIDFSNLSGLLLFRLLKPVRTVAFFATHVRICL